jgi:hypothetical protein
MDAFADLTVKFHVANGKPVVEFLAAVRELSECCIGDLEHMDAGPRARIEACLDHLKAATPAFAESIGVEVA